MSEKTGKNANVTSLFEACAENASKRAAKLEKVVKIHFLIERQKGGKHA